MFTISGETVYHNDCVGCVGDKGIVDLETNNDGYSSFRCRACGLTANISELIENLR